MLPNPRLRTSVFSPAGPVSSAPAAARRARQLTRT